MSEPSELAIIEGLRLARKFFAGRGNHSEVHLEEPKLAALLALAFHRGEMKAWRTFEHCNKAPSVGGIGRAYQAGLNEPSARKPPLIAGARDSAAMKMWKKGQRDGRSLLNLARKRGRTIS